MSRPLRSRRHSAAEISTIRIFLDESQGEGLLRCLILSPVRFTAALFRIARALERIADRFDADAESFERLVDSGKGLGR